ncbi:hypothetical protein [Micromonospora sp. NPDC005087]|uniref:hypothetical protein n=1 Tax=Micromonospora sp. NPDC005087 TaxID=3364225 RepID=UPI003686380B
MTAYLLRGGTTLGEGFSDEHSDVLVKDGRIDSIGTGVSAPDAEEIDCTASYVVPGLIDAHSHVFPYATEVGAPPDEAHLGRGVVAVNDAGTSGASSFQGFKHFVVEPARITVTCFLNVATTGVVDTRIGELRHPLALSFDDALRVATDNRDIVRGFKIRLSEDVVGDRGGELLERAVELGAAAELPLMCHIGDTTVPLPEILDRLRPGDVVAHCYTGKPNGILTEAGRVMDDVRAARERGVLFDSAHGKSNLSFAVARSAIAGGFLPDLVTSDTSARNWRGPVFDLVTTISKLHALGIGVPDLIARTTSAPAALLGLDRFGFGSVRQGALACLTVLKLLDKESELTDAEGQTMRAKRFEPIVSFANGERIPVTPWRGVA